MHVYQDGVDLVARNVSQIRKLYPAAELTLIYDGISTRGYDCNEIAGDRLKVAGKLGHWTERYLKIFLATNKPYVIKIDPDTNILRTVQNLPDPTKPTIFCRMGLDRVPHGGALGFTRPMAESILSNGWMTDIVLLRGHERHAYQDQMLRTVVWKKKLKVQVRRDFGWAGHETDEMTFSHHGTYEPYLPDRFLP